MSLKVLYTAVIFLPTLHFARTYRTVVPSVIIFLAAILDAISVNSLFLFSKLCRSREKIFILRDGDILLKVLHRTVRVKIKDRIAW